MADPNPLLIGPGGPDEAALAASIHTGMLQTFATCAGYEPRQDSLYDDLDDPDCDDDDDDHPLWGDNGGFAGDGDDYAETADAAGAAGAGAVVLQNPRWLALRKALDCAAVASMVPTQYSVGLFTALQRRPSRRNRGIKFVGAIGDSFLVFVQQDYNPSSCKISRGEVVYLLVATLPAWGGASEVFCTCLYPVANLIDLINRAATRSADPAVARALFMKMARESSECEHMRAFLGVLASASAAAARGNSSVVSSIVLEHAPARLGSTVSFVSGSEVVQVAVSGESRYYCPQCRARNCPHTILAGQPAAAAAAAAAPPQADPLHLLDAYAGTLYSRPLFSAVDLIAGVPESQVFAESQRTLTDIPSLLSVTPCICSTEAPAAPPPDELAAPPAACCGPLCTRWCWHCHRAGRPESLLSKGTEQKLSNVLFHNDVRTQTFDGAEIRCETLACAVCGVFRAPLYGARPGHWVMARRYLSAALVSDLHMCLLGVIRGQHFNAWAEIISAKGKGMAPGYGVLPRQVLMACVQTLFQHSRLPDYALATTCLFCGSAEEAETVHFDAMNGGVLKFHFHMPIDSLEGRPVVPFAFSFSEAVSINDPLLRTLMMEYIPVATTKGASVDLRWRLQAALLANEVIGSELLVALRHNPDALRPAPAPHAGAGVGAGADVAAHEHKLVVPAYLHRDHASLLQVFSTEHPSPLFGCAEPPAKLPLLVYTKSGDPLASGAAADAAGGAAADSAGSAAAGSAAGAAAVGASAGAAAAGAAAVGAAAGGAAAISPTFFQADQEFLYLAFPVLATVVESTPDHRIPDSLRPVLHAFSGAALTLWDKIEARKPADLHSHLERTKMHPLVALSTGLSCPSGPYVLRTPHTHREPFAGEYARSAGVGQHTGRGRGRGGRGRGPGRGGGRAVDGDRVCVPSTQRARRGRAPLRGRAHHHHIGFSRNFTPCTLAACCSHGVVLALLLDSNPESKRRLLELLLAIFRGAKRILYDHVCGLISYIFKRYPWIFGGVRVLGDRMHEWNHGTFSAPNCPLTNFVSRYPSAELKRINSSLSEQVNSGLSPVMTSIKFMTGPMAMCILALWQAERNITVNRKNGFCYNSVFVRSAANGGAGLSDSGASAGVGVSAPADAGAGHVGPGDYDDDDGGLDGISDDESVGANADDHVQELCDIAARLLPEAAGADDDHDAGEEDHDATVDDDDASGSYDSEGEAVLEGNGWSELLDAALIAITAASTDPS